MLKWMGYAMSVIAAAVILGWAVPLVRGAEDIKGQIEAANTVFCAAFAASDETAVTACYTPGAQVFPTGMDIVSGTIAIEAFWKGVMGGPAKALTLITTEVEQHGDTAIEVGRAEFLGASGQLLDTAKYIVIWKRVGDKWKLHRDIFNSNTLVRPEN